MAKRNDIRIALDAALEEVIVKAAGGAGTWERLVQARDELEGVVREVEKSLSEMPEGVVGTFAETAASSAGRRKGSATLEMDPDGRMVLVFSYGGRRTEALARGTVPPKPWKSDLPTLSEARNAASAAGLDVSDCGRNITEIVSRTAATKTGTRPRPGGGFIKTAPAIVPQRQVDNLDHLFDDEPEAVKPVKKGFLSDLADKVASVDLGPILDSD